ncbi:hypothetical protein B0H11DRAFT_2252255 [Mycena galericulata]|nr:hypothetical protein B0H11DRAFT_2252255 [Mycena galericulata]
MTLPVKRRYPLLSPRDRRLSNGNKETFEKQHPDDPQLVWEQFKNCSGPGVRDLASFAMLLLGLAVNQAPTERSFSDLKINKTRLRNRLGTFGASIRTENLEAGLIHQREAREVHDPTKVSGLLSVARYADTLEADDDEDGSRHSKLVKSGVAWRAEVEKWVKAAQDNEEAGTPDEEPASTAGRFRPTKIFPRSLALLFGGEVTKPVAKPRREQFTEEVLMMELLASSSIISTSHCGK